MPANLNKPTITTEIKVGELLKHFDDTLGDSAPSSEPQPSWAKPEAVSISFDARPLIESGGHPLERVMSDLSKLDDHQVYELITPFVPAPLIDIAKQKGFDNFSASENAEQVRTYFKRTS